MSCLAGIEGVPAGFGVGATEGVVVALSGVVASYPF